MGIFSGEWNGWDILWGVLSGGISAFIKMGVQAAEAQEEAEKAAAEIEKLRSRAKDDIVNLPYLRGASNTFATGKTQPYVIGTHLITPFVLNGSSSGSKGYHTIGGYLGQNSYYNVIRDLGFNKQILNRIFCKDITLKKLSAPEPQEGIIHFPENNVFAGKESFMEVSQDGQPFETSAFNEKIVEQSPNDQLELHPSDSSQDGGDEDTYKDLYYTLEPNSRAADVGIMINGLFHTTAEGVRGIGTRTVYPYFSLDYARLVAEGDEDADSHATWNLFPFERSEFKPAVIKTHRRTYYLGDISNLKNQGILTSLWNRGDVTDEQKIKYIFEHQFQWSTSVPVNTSGLDRSDFGPFYSETTPEEYSDKTYIQLRSYKVYNHRGLIYNEEQDICQCFDVCWDEEESPEQIVPWSGTLLETCTFSYNKSVQLMFNAHVDFAHYVNPNQPGTEQDLTDDILSLEYPVTIKVTSPTRKPESGTTNNTTYVKFIHSYCYDKALSNAEGDFVPERILEARIASMSTLLGLHIQATKANEDKLDFIQVITSGLAKTWNGEAWSETKSVTSNPASWLLEVLTSAAHSASAMDESEIDLAAFGAWYEYCAENVLNINYVVTDGTPKLNLIEIILNAGRAETYRDPSTGKLSVAFDCIQDDDSSVPVLSEQNLVSFNWQKDLKRKPDGYKITFINAQEEYREDSIILMYVRYRTIDGVQVDLWKYPEKRDPESVIEELNATGITSFTEAFNFGLYTMRCYNLRPKTVSALAGPYAFNFKPYQKLLVQHPTIKKGLGSSEIKAVITDENEKVTGAELYTPLDLPQIENVHYYCIITVIRADGIMNVSAEISSRGHVREIEFVTPNVYLDYIKAGSLLVYDTSLETAVSPMILTGSSPSGSSGWALSLADYNEDIFDDSDEIPEYVPHFSDIHAAGQSLPETVPEPVLTYEALSDAVEEIKSVALQPYIYSDVTSAGVYVGDDNSTTQKQIIRAVCHVIIANEEREFSFGQITLPSGWTYEIDYHTVIITVPSGAKVTKGGFNIPINYREIFEDATLVDEEENEYADEEGAVYHTFRMGDTIITYDLPFGYVGVKGGNYRGKYNSIRFTEGVPVAFVLTETVEEVETEVAILRFADCVIGDYITWTGDVTDNLDFVRGGILRTSRLYKYCGSLAEKLFEEDTDQTHTMNAMTDVMSVLSDELEENKNNTAEQYLGKLVANDVFVDKLVANDVLVQKLVASEAFIDKLATRVITLQQGGQIKSYWAENNPVFTNVILNNTSFEIYTAVGLWYQQEKESFEKFYFCLSNEYTNSRSSLTYQTEDPTIEELNQYSYLYIKITKSSQSGSINQYYTVELQKPYFKLDSDTGKITARDMVAINMHANGGVFSTITANDMSIKGNSKFSGELDCGALQVKKSIMWTTVKDVQSHQTIYYNVWQYFLSVAQQAHKEIIGNYISLEALYPNFEYVKGYYGNTKILNVMLDHGHISQPFSAEIYYVYFNSGNLQLVTYLGQKVEESYTTEELVISRSDGTTLAFKLEELPSTKPDEANVVYCLSDNILRLS